MEKKQRTSSIVIYVITLFWLGLSLIPEPSFAQVFIAAKKSKSDYVGKSERLGKNGKNDVRLRFTLSEKNKTLTDIEIRNIERKSHYRCQGISKNWLKPLKKSEPDKDQPGKQGDNSDLKRRQLNLNHQKIKLG